MACERCLTDAEVQEYDVTVVRSDGLSTKAPQILCDPCHEIVANTWKVSKGRAVQVAAQEAPVADEPAPALVAETETATQ